MHRINATDAARSFSDIINRAYYRHENFVVLRNGEEVARILPPKPKVRWNELVITLLPLANPDADFGIELEAIQTEQPRLPADPWDS